MLVEKLESYLEDMEEVLQIFEDLKVLTGDAQKVRDSAVKKANEQEAQYLLAEYGKKEGEGRLATSFPKVEEIKMRLKSVMFDHSSLVGELKGIHERVIELESMKTRNFKVRGEISDYLDRFTAVEEKNSEETRRLDELGVAKFRSCYKHIIALNLGVVLRLDEVIPGREVDTDGNLIDLETNEVIVRLKKVALLSIVLFATGPF